MNKNFQAPKLLVTFSSSFFFTPSLNKSLFEASTQRHSASAGVSCIKYALGESPRTTPFLELAETRRHRSIAADLLHLGPHRDHPPCSSLHLLFAYSCQTLLHFSTLLDEDMSPCRDAVAWTLAADGLLRMTGSRAMPRSVASGAKDLLSRLIGMRLLGLPSYSMGLILEARGSNTSHHCFFDGIAKLFTF